MTTLYSVSQSTISVMGIELVVHVLNTGERVVEAESVERFFTALGGPDTLTPDEIETIMRGIFP